MLFGYLEYDVIRGYKVEIEFLVFFIVIVRIVYNYILIKLKNFGIEKIM